MNNALVYDVDGYRYDGLQPSHARVVESSALTLARGRTHHDGRDPERKKIRHVRAVLRAAIEAQPAVIRPNRVVYRYADGDAVACASDENGHLSEFSRRKAVSWRDAWRLQPGTARKLWPSDAVELWAHWRRAIGGGKCPPRVWDAYRSRRKRCELGNALAATVDGFTGDTVSYIDDDTDDIVDLPVESVAQSWALAWRDEGTDTRARLATVCGKRTLLHTARHSVTGKVSHMAYRHRCKQAACEHCARHYLRPKWQRRISAAMRENAESGRDMAFLTLTLDPAAWCKVRGLPVEASHTLAHREISRMFAAFMRKTRDILGPGEYIRIIEPHKSGYPHIHAVIAGGIPKTMRQEGQERGGLRASWKGVCEYKRHQMREKKAGKIRVARCPTPTTRAMVAKIAESVGFGGNVSLHPLDVSDHEKIAKYTAKTAHDAQYSDLYDDGIISAEMAKSSQRTGAILANGVRYWQASQGWQSKDARDECDAESSQKAAREEKEEEEGEWVTDSIVSVPVTIDAMREAIGESDVKGDVIAVDFTGKPEKGKKRPRSDLESLSLASDPLPVFGHAMRVRDLAYVAQWYKSIKEL